MESKIDVKQINLHHSKSATSLICNHMNAMHTKKTQNLVVLIQEPWIKKNDKKSKSNKKYIQGFDENAVDLFYNKDNNDIPRTCIVTTKGLKATMLPQFSSRDITTIVVNVQNGNNNEELLFSSVYMPYEERINIPDKTARDAIEHSASSGIPIIIGADCNAHHSLWGSSDINMRGEKLAEYLATTMLDIQNIGNEPTFVTQNRQEVLDITLTTQNFSERIRNWAVSCDDALSDHREINFQVDCEVQPGALYRNPRNTDWSIYNKILQSKIGKVKKHLLTVNTTKELDRAVACITKAMYSAFICACPGRVNKPKSNHWWNNELQKLKLETRRLYRVAKANKGRPNESIYWQNLRESRSLYAKEIRRAQAESWKKFCASIEGAKATSRLHKVLAKNPAKEPGILKNENNSYTSNSHEAAQLLLNTHFPGCVSQENSEIHVNNGSFNEVAANVNNLAEYTDTQQIDINNTVNYDRVRWAIHSFEKYKSPGFDNIYPIMLQKGWNIMGEHIVNIYKACLDLGHVPKKWNEVKVVFIPKPGKDNYTSPKSFRPISLTSTLLKGLERLVDRHMKERMEESSRIHYSQHAFQQGKSTETALHELVSQIEYTLTKGEYLIATFMDIAGAFDNVSFDAVITSLVTHGFGNQIIRWIQYMLSNRNITLNLGGQNMTVRATRGTPQGGVLSPTLWILVMDDLLKELHSKHLDAIGYADDLTVICKGKFLGELSSRTQKAVRIVEKWCSRVGLTVNPEKSEIVIFTRNRKLDGFKAPMIFGREITRQESAKYLGVILDSKLTWKKHIEYRLEKSLKIFWCCRKAIGKAWGITPKSILWLYTAIVRPLLSYGSFLWWRGTETAYTQNKLSHIQRVACLAITGAMSTTPQDAMEALLSLPKLHVYIKAEAKNTAHRLRDCITNLQLETAEHTNILKELYVHNVLLQADDDFIQTIYIFKRNFEIRIPDRECWTNGQLAIDYYSHVYFTDGAVSKHSSGYGALYARSHTIIKGNCGKEANITQVEIAAIHACCIDAMRKHIEGRICIYTDSIGALNALASYKINSRMTLECVDMLETLARTNEITLIWIPSHSGFYGNEIADKIAKHAAREEINSVEPQIAIARGKVRDVTDKWLANQTILSWATAPKCEHSKCFLQQCDVRITKKLLEMSKNDIRIAVGIITGHCKLNKHLVTIRLRDDPDCDFCGVNETAKHILCECPRLTPIRQQIYARDFIEPVEICKYPLQNVVTFYKRCSEIHNHISRAF